MKIAVIGSGAMGEAIVASVLRGGVATPRDVAVADTVAERVRAVSSRYGVETAEGDGAAAHGARYVVLAVKPQDFPAAAADLRGALAEGATLVSIMAGIGLGRLTRETGHAAAVRAMPNTPAQVGEGMTVWTATPAVDASAREEVGRIFASMGRQLYVPEEKYLDMATAVSGSGPGFVLLFVEAFIDAAVHVGLAREAATEMVLQTVAGSLRLARESGKHPAELRNLVTSPAGTTAAGLRALEERGLRAALTEAVIAAYNKSVQLGEVEKGQ